MNFKLGVLGLAAICVMATAAIGQKSLVGGPAITENFDSLGTTTVVVTDNGPPITGVYSRKSLDTDGNATGNTFTPSTGFFSAATNYNFGVAGAGLLTDRALGGISGDAGVGDLSYGVRFVNSGVTTITSISVGYTGEHWRDSNSAGVLTFDYRVSATPITDLTTGTYTAVAALTYTPNNPGGTGALDGNAAANRQVFAPVNILLSAPLLPGHELMLRWTDLDLGGADDGTAIDDLVVSVIGATAGDATISGRVTDAFGRAISSALITVQDSNGTSKLAYTNSFGYYKVIELEAGLTYIVGVSARRYTFANPTYVVDLSDNFSGANFVASR